MKYILTILISILIVFTLDAQRASDSYYYSINDGLSSGGNWTNGAYWSDVSGGSPLGSTPGVNPGSHDIMYIETYLEMDASITSWGYLEIKAGDSLKTTVNDLGIKGGGTLVVKGVLEVYNLTFYNGSIIDIQPGAKVIVLNNFTNMNNSDNVNVDGDITVNGTFDNGNGGDVTGTGTITASNYTGTGTTFGYENGTIPAGTTVSPGALPIELISFDGKLSGSQVKLSWKTASEFNNDYFTLERSSDGVNFETIGRVDGKGTYNGLSEYGYTDYKPLANTSYYRLKQTDFDGKFTYSELVSVKNNISLINTLDYSLYPNPVAKSQNAQIEITSNVPNQEVLIVVNNMLGQQMYSKVLVTDNNGKVLQAIDPYKQLSAGTYIVVASANDKLVSKRLVIQ